MIPRISNDLVALLSATAQSRLHTVEIDIDERHACTIVVASGGYPNEFRKGLPISGLEATDEHDVLLFHAGTRQTPEGVVTNGGRVCCVTALAANLDDAVAAARQRIATIQFEEKYYRRDIGYEFIR